MGSQFLNGIRTCFGCQISTFIYVVLFTAVLLRGGKSHKCRGQQGQDKQDRQNSGFSFHFLHSSLRAGCRPDAGAYHGIAWRQNPEFCIPTIKYGEKYICGL